ncbi:MAG: cysteine desulfurase [Flavobacteriales bacterium]|jgi:cysteine desulfurase|nr:cysteine desulfurase [Flavobacteriales bacterium]|tara:strand:- start:2668 stop:3798 length:1131 start_codon:yes stop_codon:yes gene_type:complete
MKVYLDNAATTPIDQEVLEVMIPILQDGFGNPSSIHSFGRVSRSLIERARKNVAKHLNCTPGEIFFTSGGTEADNMAIRCGMVDLGINHAITSKIEHHAVGHTLEDLASKGMIKLSYVDLDEKGNVDLSHLEELLKTNNRSFVSLMHANNEIGNLLDIHAVGELCQSYDAIFHSDTVQTMAHYTFDLENLNIQFITGAAHKFHGPKGNGFLYINSDVKINPFISGGGQERNMRAGTENVYGIVGLSKAMDVSYRDLQEHRKHIEGLKIRMIKGLKEAIPGVEFNGESDQLEKSLYTVLNVLFPQTEIAEMLFYNLDIMGIASSGGSACSSGSNLGSHVLRGIGVDMNRPSLRFSFSKYNTQEEIDYTVSQLKSLLS